MTTFTITTSASRGGSKLAGVVGHVGIWGHRCRATRRGAQGQDCILHQLVSDQPWPA